MLLEAFSPLGVSVRDLFHRGGVAFEQRDELGVVEQTVDLFGMTAVGTITGTSVALTADMETGLVDRFRSLPISRAAVLAGRNVADLATNLLGLAILAGTGLLIGWRVLSR